MLLTLSMACSSLAPVDLDRDGYDTRTDCDDDDASVHPDAHEYCDGVDNDCDGRTDGTDALGQQVWYEDDDGDGYGDPSSEAVTSCFPGPAWSRFSTDCDDADPERHPKRSDDCNGLDDDCNGTPDDAPGEPRYLDADADGHGDPGQRVSVCAGSAPAGDDCNDLDAAIYPGAPESCDGIDSDCDRRDDSVDAWLDIPTWYADLDGDGFGIDTVSLAQCVPPGERWSLVAGDCDDLASDAYPGAVQSCTSRDTDCDGQPGNDLGWFAVDQPWRAPFSLENDAPAGTPVTFDLDIGAALAAGPVDLSSVTVALQDCEIDRARALPAAGSDVLSPWLLEGDPVAPTGDGHVTIVFIADEALPSGTLMAVYLGGPPSIQPGTVVSTETTLQSASLSLSVDPDRGGLIDELAASGVRVASQADARDGNGLEVDGSWTQWGLTETELVLDSPSVGVLHVDGVHEGLRYSAWLSVFEGVPAVYATLALTAEEDLLWDGGAEGVRPFDLVPLDLLSPVAQNESDWASLSGEAGGVMLGWLDAPDADAAVYCSESGCSATGTEGQGPAAMALAGERIVDHRQIALLPYAGTDAPAVPTTVYVDPSRLQAR